MSEFTEPTLEQIELLLRDYQSELTTIDAETNLEKERILSAIQTEEAEIKSLLDRYRTLKRQQQLAVVQSSYNRLSDFKQSLLLKIKSTTENSDRHSLISQSSLPQMEGGEPKKLLSKTNSLPAAEIKKFTEFIDGISPQELVKLYPADLVQALPDFKSNDPVIRGQLLRYYKKQNLPIYHGLLKLYQKPDLSQGDNPLPQLEQLPGKDRQYHEFLQANYPNALPFFWFLINREPNSIRYVVMELALDHIIQTNTLDNDPDRRDLSLSLSDLLEMNNQAPVAEFIRDLFICFHPQRVSQKSSSKNRYFDYISSLIKNQSTLEESYVLQMWNQMNQAGYHAVSAADFQVSQIIQEEQNGHSKSLAPASQHDLL